MLSNAIMSQILKVTLRTESLENNTIHLGVFAHDDTQHPLDTMASVSMRGMYPLHHHLGLSITRGTCASHRAGLRPEHDRLARQRGWVGKRRMSHYIAGQPRH